MSLVYLEDPCQPESPTFRVTRTPLPHPAFYLGFSGGQKFSSLYFVKSPGAEEHGGEEKQQSWLCRLRGRLTLVSYQIES